MQPKVTPDYAAPSPARPVPWHDELRFTLIGSAVGGLAAVSIVPAFFTFLDHGGFWAVPYLCPVTYQLVRLLMPPSPFPFLFLVAWVVGGFFEWVVWGIVVDLCRAFARAHRRQSGVA